MSILQQFDDILKGITEDELEKINTSSFSGNTEFEVIRKVFISEGKKEGIRIILQKINEYASKNI